MFRTRATWSIVVGVLLAMGPIGCGDSDEDASVAPDDERPSEEFCEAAYEYDQQVAILGPDADEHVELVEPMATHAPDDIKADAERFLDALRRVARGEDSVVDDPDVEAASERVHRRAIEGCRLYDQGPPGGL